MIVRTIPALLPPLLACACATAASPSPSPVPAETRSAVEEAWQATAAQHVGRDGEQFDYDCPAGGEPHRVWGSDVYTDDSSVCTAAVHAGAITFDEGGAVTIEIRPGQDAYEGTDRNGVETSDYGSWGGSFVIVSGAGD